MYQQELIVNGELEQAWREFVQDGVINQNIVRPEIARSWFRCKKTGNTADMQPLPDHLLRAKQENNRKMIEASRSILQDVAVMLAASMPCFAVILLDNEGDIIEMIDHNTGLLCLGHHCSELKSGTNAGGIALIDGAGVEVVGYEHLYPFAHKWHTLAVPLRNSHRQVAGVFGVLNTEGPCPVLAMQTVSLGAQLIETRLQRDQIFVDVSGLMVERILEPAILVNQNGLILDANQPFADLFMQEHDDLRGNNINACLRGEINFKTLLSPAIHLDHPVSVSIQPFNQKLKKSSFVCSLSKYIVKADNENGLIIFTFSGINHNECQSINKSLTDRQEDAFACLIGNNEAFLKVIKSARRAARISSTILIEGRSGTGKELMARAIHQESKRSGAFLALNCGSLPKELLYSELFGYEDGAFTGARRGGNAGKFELADGGTLFLDEIGEMPLDMQVSLLRFLEDKTVTRIGGSKTKRVDVRIVAATNRNLTEEVQQGNFREDLFYRINVIHLTMPALLTRKDDLDLLVKHLLHQLELKHGFDNIVISADVMKRFEAHDWPGNVRELQNVLESSLIAADQGMITLECLPDYLQQNARPVRPAVQGNLREIEKYMIMETLQRNDHNISQAARELGITRTTLYKKMEQMGLKRTV
ncbi:MAG TPA: sigma-54-dependent Fis family transcriptional regulator [Syntrophomonas sp.]|nr:sigma-54-dependent Fis family transcriptional regulator [Syntrophomonas sp.]